VRVPAYGSARTRVMHSATTITTDDLTETSVDVTLNTHVYKAVGVSDEDLTLGIRDFGAQVMAPAIGAVGRGIEDVLSAAIDGATYQTWLDLNDTDPYLTFLKARIALNNARVPLTGRFLAVGSAIEEKILASDRLSKFDTSGSSDAMREAVIGRIAGFTAVSCPGIEPDTAIAAHESAFPLAVVAPSVPSGASWGASMTEPYSQMAIRVLRDYDVTNVKDRLLVDCFVGVGVAKDKGTLDGSGRFTPDSTQAAILVRAVKITISGT
jgi:hypothetical protein